MNHTVKIERMTRLLACVAVLAVIFVIPAFATGNEYAEKGAQWVLDGIYWIALVVIAWRLFKEIAARNVTGAVVLVLLGALCIVLITKPEVLKTVGEKLLGILGLS